MFVCMCLNCILCISVCMCVCVCFLPHCSGIPVEKVVWRERTAFTVWAFMDLAPMGQSGLHCSQTKPLQQDPDTHRKGSNRRRETQERGRQGNKGRESGEGVEEGAMGEGLCGSSHFPKRYSCDGLTSATGPIQRCSALNFVFWFNTICLGFDYHVPNVIGMPYKLWCCTVPLICSATFTVTSLKCFNKLRTLTQSKLSTSFIFSRFCRWSS